MCAEKLLAWIDDNNRQPSCTYIYAFSEALYKKLKTCCEHPREVKFRTLRQRMWEKYFKFCCSIEPFLKESGIGLDANPIFF